VTSNCVLNLAPDSEKPWLLGEIHRPGRRAAISDMVPDERAAALRDPREIKGGRLPENDARAGRVRRRGLLLMPHPDGLALSNARGERRGYVEPKQIDGRPVLEDLWVMQGSVCDLKCKHCYTASSPSNNRLEQISFSELRPHLEDAARFGVQKIYFTGGEVFVNGDVLRGRAARVLITPLGRAVQMNAGAAVAKGDVLLFLHADVRLGKGALDVLRRRMADPVCIGGNFDIHFEDGDVTAHIFTSINRWRRRCGIFYGDSGIFCRREVFEQLGGYKPWPILEDYEFVRRLWKLGNLSLLEEPRVVKKLDHTENASSSDYPARMALKRR
jgi:hypothetical protein